MTPRKHLEFIAAIVAIMLMSVTIGFAIVALHRVMELPPIDDGAVDFSNDNPVAP